MELCMALGWRSLEALMHGMSSQEFSLWKEKYHKRPWGDLRADLRSAKVAHTVATMAGKVLKKSLTLEDFMLFSDKEEAESDDPITKALLRKE